MKQRTTDNIVSCDYCKKTAHYDAKTDLGCWAYMCHHCFNNHGIGLGLGLGQKLIYEEKVL